MSAIEQITLQGMLNAFTEEEIKDLFENFFCRDKDIESFLRFKAIEFEKAKKARIYLFLILIKDVWLAFFLYLIKC